MNQGNNIKNQIIRAIQVNESFAFVSSTNIQQRKLRRLVEGFYSSCTFGELERRARRLMNFILYQHEKSVAVGAALESLNNLELFGNYQYRQQRLHYTHQANVFLLGLFLYHNLSRIRNFMRIEMECTTEIFTVNINGHSRPIQYSGGNEYGEFLFRWRMAALSHDLGHGISLARNDVNEINDYLKEISTFIPGDIERIDDLWMFRGENLLNKLDKAIPNIRLSRYMRHQQDNPFNDSVHFDHGILSALIFLRLIHEEYLRHEDCRVTKVGDTNVVWYNEFLDTSILESAVAIALHNLDQYTVALSNATENVRIFDSQVRPLAWLLKVADVLQEWDKLPADNVDMGADLSTTNINMDFYNNKIIVRNFDEDISREILSKINTYFHDTNIMDFR